jgi:hypothetical protein
MICSSCEKEMDQEALAAWKPLYPANMLCSACMNQQTPLGSESVEDTMKHVLHRALEKFEAAKGCRAAYLLTSGDLSVTDFLTDLSEYVVEALQESR